MEVVQRMVQRSRITAALHACLLVSAAVWLGWLLLQTWCVFIGSNRGAVTRDTPVYIFTAFDLVTNWAWLSEAMLPNSLLYAFLLSALLIGLLGIAALQRLAWPSQRWRVVDWGAFVSTVLVYALFVLSVRDTPGMNERWRHMENRMVWTGHQAGPLRDVAILAATGYSSDNAVYAGYYVRTLYKPPFWTIRTVLVAWVLPVTMLGLIGGRVGPIMRHHVQRLSYALILAGSLIPWMVTWAKSTTFDVRAGVVVISWWYPNGAQIPWAKLPWIEWLLLVVMTALACYGLARVAFVRVQDRGAPLNAPGILETLACVVVVGAAFFANVGVWAGRLNTPVLDQMGIWLTTPESGFPLMCVGLVGVVVSCIWAVVDFFTLHPAGKQAIGSLLSERTISDHSLKKSTKPWTRSWLPDC